MSEWETRSLGQLCEHITVGHVGSMASRYVNSGVPFLRSQNVRAGRLDLENIKHIPRDFHQELSKSKLRAGDVVIVRTGEPGAAARIPDDLGEANCSDLVIARPTSTVDSRFLCYAINVTARHYISAHTVGAVQQHFNVGAAKNMLLKVPSLADQAEIVAVLGALDDKIEVNAQCARTASELARTQFQGCKSGSGMDVSLGDLVDLVYGKALREPDRRDGRFPVFGCTGQVGWHDTPLSRAAGAVVGRKGANAGAVSWSPQPCWVIDTAFYVEPQSTKVTPEFAYFLLQSAGLEGLVGDSAIPGLNRTAALSRLVPDFDGGVISRLTHTVRPLLALVDTAERQNRTLAELRDTLLPKLMSGEIRVRDAEKVVEDVT